MPPEFLSVNWRLTPPTTQSPPASPTAGSTTYTGEPTTLDQIEARARENPGRTAMLCYGEAIAYRTFYEDARRFASALTELHVARGQIVLVSYPHVYIHWLLLIACECVGAISVTFGGNDSIEGSPIWPRADFVIAEHAPPAGLDRATFVRADTAWLTSVFHRAAGSPSDPPQVRLGFDEGQRIVHSSGTTGGQKAMLFTRGMQEGKLKHLQTMADLARDERILLTHPFSVNSTYLLATLGLRIGALVVADPPMPAIREHGITYFDTLPVMLEQLLQDLPADFVKPSRLRVRVIGAALPQSLRERSLRALCTDIASRYATNEVWPVVPDVGDDRTGTIQPGIDARIVDEQDVTLPHAQVGFVALRSATMIHEYVDDAAATQRHFRDGWFFPGDLAELLDDRRLRLVGRGDDVLNCGGIKQSPDRLESQLRAIPGVLDAGVTSMPSGSAIDDLCVGVVLKPGVDPQMVRAQTSMLTEGWPKIVFTVLSAVPRTANGKIMRAALRDVFRRGPPQEELQ